MNREPGITVTHEDLLVGVTAITTPLGGLHLSKDRHQRPGRVHLDLELTGFPLPETDATPSSSEGQWFVSPLCVPELGLDDCVTAELHGNGAACLDAVHSFPRHCPRIQTARHRGEVFVQAEPSNS